MVLRLAVHHNDRFVWGCEPQYPGFATEEGHRAGHRPPSAPRLHSQSRPDDEICRVLSTTQVGMGSGAPRLSTVSTAGIEPHGQNPSHKKKTGLVSDQPPKDPRCKLDWWCQLAPSHFWAGCEAWREVGVLDCMGLQKQGGREVCWIELEGKGRRDGGRENGIAPCW